MFDAVLAEQVVEHLRGRIDESVVADFESFWRHGEYGLAVEFLCDELYERGEALPDGALSLVREVGESMGLERRSFVILTRDG